jgi:hypothetical protein
MGPSPFSPARLSLLLHLSGQYRTLSATTPNEQAKIYRLVSFDACRKMITPSTFDRLPGFRSNGAAGNDRSMHLHAMYALSLFPDGFSLN